jgi:pimeloyl-ACP methyl ester carboxylesterase
VNLLGISYGTRVALTYLRRYPAHTRAVVLDAVVPPDLALGADHAKNLDAALAKEWTRCANDDPCKERFGGAKETLARLRRALGEAPRSVRYRHPTTGEAKAGTVDRMVLAAVVRILAYDPSQASLLPLVLAAADHGDFQPLMTYWELLQDSFLGGMARGLELSVICAEDADRLAVRPEDADTLLGDLMVRVTLASCEVWPKGDRPPDFSDPVKSEVPTLILSGGLDPVTPPRYGEAVAAHLSRARHAVAPGAGHGVFATACGGKAVARLFETLDPAALDLACFDAIEALPPFSSALGWGP